MTSSDKKSAGTPPWVWFLIAVVLIASSWAIADWADFKQGMLEGYSRRAGRQP